MFEGRIVKAVGTMSGTSLDGVDAAVVETDGETISGFGPNAYRPYTQSEQAVLRAHLGCWQSDDVASAERVVMDAHSAVLSGFEDVALVGFHGQTLAHDPADRRTHQCGDGAALAKSVGLPVAWDFRTADVAAGGQGAPLAPFYHFALAKWIEADAPLAILNLGGVGNITWIELAQPLLGRYRQGCEQLLILIVHCCKCPRLVGNILWIELAQPPLGRPCKGCEQLLLPVVDCCKCSCYIGNFLWIELAQPPLGRCCKGCG